MPRAIPVQKYLHTMNASQKLYCIFYLLMQGLFFYQTANAQLIITSPDKTINISVSLNKKGQAFYNVKHNNREVVKASSLGIVRTDEDFSTGLHLKSATPSSVVKDIYILSNGKKRNINYTANKRVFRFHNRNGQALEIIFQVSNDGLAFRYHFPGTSSDVKTVLKETTSYNFPVGTKGWLQPMSIAKSGWEQTNPAYEEYYEQSIAAGTPSPLKAGWVYPALFQTAGEWVLITEAGMEGDYCATRLASDSGSNEYRVAFPSEKEVISNDGLLPQSSLPWHSPWRIITIGGLRTIIESTLGTDLAKPAIKLDTAFIKPGKAAWSWIMSKDDSIVYSEQKRYIDFAADMKWRYCLIDADWDRKIGYESIKELASYANTKNVGLLLWYNSAGDWNTVKYTPKNLLLTKESRRKEFARLRDMGIKGVKVDFFGGDGRSVIKYYIDILKDAAEYKLLVNFHGATLPRGWARTYPHLMTTEAVRGFEMVTFNQADAEAEANHCAMLPFTRNAFDPMDFTPMNLYKIPTKVQRKTTSAFELATSVLFLSGIQHYAESPAGMTTVPAYVKEFLQQLPSTWNDVKYIDGFPGKLVVIARRKDNHWYIAGINGEAIEKQLLLNLAWLKNLKGSLITDGEEPLSFVQLPVSVDKSGNVPITIKPNGGFVIVF